MVIDSHVPAYGYGKNHGWSRIIRIVRPLSEHAISLLSSFNRDGPANSVISKELLDAQVSHGTVILYWHYFSKGL